MHVQCESCGTEYEFDDALVSGRGTTVKCSTCSFQFKVRKSGASPQEDQWTVTSADGAVYVYASLRELQRAILSREVVASDLLERGGVAPRPIGQIAELVPFFEDKRRAPSGGLTPAAPSVREAPDPPTMRTGPPPAVEPPAPAIERGRLDPDRTAATPARLLEEHLAATRTPVPPPPDPPTMQPVSGAGPGPTPLDPMRPRVHTEIGFPAPPSRPLDDLSGAEDEPTRVADHLSLEAEAADQGIGDLRAALGSAPRSAPSGPVAPSGPSGPSPAKVEVAEQAYLPEVSSPLPPSAHRRQPSGGVGGARADASGDQWVDSGVPRAAPARRSVGGVVVAGVVLLAVAGMGAYYVRGRGERPAAALDAKADAFLAAGEKALVEGDLDRAKENLDKASVLAEKNPRLLLDIARLATARADVSWVRQQVVGSEGDVAAARAKTAELAAAALVAADAAVSAAPDEPAAVRTKIDALRAAGQLEKARGLVPKVVSQGNQSESAYVLAALDMATADPVWSTVLQRLRLAASVEGASGRARAALVLALARSGDREGARAELARIEAASASHPLIGPLRAYLDRKAPEGAPPARATEDAGVDVSALKALSGGAPTDPRVLVSQAETARSRGKYAVARRLYELALQKNPQDSEALTGLAHVAHAEHDVAGAKSAYRRALGVNPSYVPALVGLADLEWESGERGAAQKSYREIVDRFPESAYPARVKQRADVGAPAPTVPSPTAPPAPSAPPTATETPVPVPPVVPAPSTPPAPPPDPTP